MKEIDKRRQRKINKALEERDLVRLWHKQERLWEGKRACNVVKLEKPIQRGYHRFFVLRQDIARSDEAKVYRPLLKYMNNYVNSRDGSFMYKKWGEKVKRPVPQGISSIDHKKWNEIEATLTLKQKSMFDKRWHQYFHKGKPSGGHWEWHFTKPWMFVYKVEPYYVTHRVVINPQLESETAEIWGRIWSNGRYYKIAKRLGWRVNDRDWEDRRALLVRRALSKLENQEIINYEEKTDYKSVGIPIGDSY